MHDRSLLCCLYLLPCPGLQAVTTSAFGIAPKCYQDGGRCEPPYTDHHASGAVRPTDRTCTLRCVLRRFRRPRRQVTRVDRDRFYLGAGRPGLHEPGPIGTIAAIGPTIQPPRRQYCGRGESCRLIVRRIAPFCVPAERALSAARTPRLSVHRRGRRGKNVNGAPVFGSAMRRATPRRVICKMSSASPVEDGRTGGLRFMTTGERNQEVNGFLCRVHAPRSIP